MWILPAPWSKHFLELHAHPCYLYSFLVATTTDDHKLDGLTQQKCVLPQRKLEARNQGVSRTRLPPRPPGNNPFLLLLKHSGEGGVAPVFLDFCLCTFQSPPLSSSDLLLCVSSSDSLRTLVGGFKAHVIKPVNLTSKSLIIPAKIPSPNKVTFTGPWG